MRDRWTMLPFIVAILCSANLLVASPVLAQQDLGAEHVKISLDTTKSRKVKDKNEKAKYSKDWKKACDHLGKAMTVGKGVWGFGTFGSFTCYLGKKKVGGQEKAAKWTLDVVDSRTEVSYTVSLLQGGGKVEVAKFTTPPSDYTMQFFADDEWTDLVAYSIMDKMPAGMMIAKSMVKGTPPTVTGRYQRLGKSSEFKYQVPPPLEELVLFRLAFDPQSKTWRSTVAGTAKRTKVVEPKVEASSKKKGKKSKKGKAASPADEAVPGEVVYELSAEANEALATGPLWAQGSGGPGARDKELAAITTEAQQSLDDAAKNGTLGDFLKGKIKAFADLLDTVSFGYVGLRYGLQVLSGDELLGKTSFFGLLAEFRGGPLKGLRYYYDKLTKTSAKQEAPDGTKVDTSIEWSRHVLGFSWDFDPGLLVSRVTIAPKVGLWSFKATLPTAKDENGKVSDVDTFNLGNTVSLALEVGLEWLSDWYLMRTWYSIDTGISLGKGGKVTSNRMGLDAYFMAGPTFGSFKTALLAFYMYESVDLASPQRGDVAAGEVAATGVKYDGAYAGGGVAISW